MQQFTRALTREILVGGERLAVTFSAEGLSIRPVGSRRPPHTLSWEACVWACANRAGATLGPDQILAALDVIKAGGERSAAGGGATPAPTETNPAASPRASEGLRGSLARLGSWLQTHRPQYHKGLLPGATPAELEALQTTLGVQLPEDLRTWLGWHNGQSAEVFGALEENWHPMSTTEIAEAKRELDAEGHPGWRRSWIPFLDDDNGDYLCLDPDEAASPVRECWRGKPEHEVAAPSLAAWVEQFLHRLEHGEYTEDPERGGFHRNQEAAH
jgi:cell wall assembly regulator SMI1